MGADLFKLLSEGKTYLWALRHSQRRNLNEVQIQDIKAAFSENGIDVGTLMALRQFEYAMARYPHPSVQSSHFKEFYFLPIPAFNIEVYFKASLCEHGLEAGFELFPSLLDWQFGHDEVQYCIGGDTTVDMITLHNMECTRQVRLGDVVATPKGTNFITHSTEDNGQFGHAHMFLCNVGEQEGQVFYDVGGLLRLQSLGIIDPAPPGAMPFEDITDRIELKDWRDMLTVHSDRERDLPTWLRNGWQRREEARALDYAEGTRLVVKTSPDRQPDDFIEWGTDKRRCFVNPLIAEQTAAITDCRFPSGYKRLHPHKELWTVLSGQAKINQSIAPLHSEWVEIDLSPGDIMVAANGAHIHVLEATNDFIVRRMTESGAHNAHFAMMEKKLILDKVPENI
jgi:mannose-6-phosphate isomerase-like protein (cupin superfamily)